MPVSISRELGTGSVIGGGRRIVERARIERADMGGGASMGSSSASMGGSSFGSTGGGTVPPGLLEDVLDGFVPPSDVLRRRIYAEMFHNDPVMGGGVDLLSSFPFSTFTLSGVNDENRLRKYWQSVDMIDVRSLLPALSVNYLIYGCFVGCLNWDERAKIYNALVPMNLDFCNMQTFGMWGMDPVVNVQFPKEMKALLDGKLSGSNARNKEVIQQLRENITRIPDQMLVRMKSQQGITLDSNSLLYIARGGRVEDFGGVSILKRCLPIWLMEKALIRGTLDQVWKRLRSILLVTVGDQDWEPLSDEYNSITNLLLGADSDPTGAIVALRNGINVQEIRRGDDFFSYNNFYDFSANAKLNAMGISQSFVTGDATIAAMEGAVNVTLQHFKTYRDILTKKIFYDKIFPMVAIKNGYLRKEKNIVVGGMEHATVEQAFAYAQSFAWNDPIRYDPIMREFRAEISDMRSGNAFNTDTTRLSMPKVLWQDSLDANTAEEINAKLEMAEKHGMPIPYRWLAANAGATVEDWAEQRDSDMKWAAFFKSYRDARAQFDPQDANAGQDDGMQGAFASLSHEHGLLENNEVWRNGRADDQGAFLLGQGGIRRGPGPLGRDWGDLGEPRRETHKGTLGAVLSPKTRGEINNKVHRTIHEASMNVRQHDAWHAEQAKPEPTRTQHRAFPLSRRHQQG